MLTSTSHSPPFNTFINSRIFRNFGVCFSWFFSINRRYVYLQSNKSINVSINFQRFNQFSDYLFWFMRKFSQDRQKEARMNWRFICQKNNESLCGEQRRKCKFQRFQYSKYDIWKSVSIAECGFRTYKNRFIPSLNIQEKIKNDLDCHV